MNYYIKSICCHCPGVGNYHLTSQDSVHSDQKLRALVRRRGKGGSSLTKDCKIPLK